MSGATPRRVRIYSVRGHDVGGRWATVDDARKSNAGAPGGGLRGRPEPSTAEPAG
ncbi:hypothetical protein ACFPM0_20455 [Pseudonocardia sulfidoxydans]|uniref:hypothetical protein n=1 Tax=Pseudonocardia sulfidoxydans TaxID=54011 RepID=UPI00360E1D3E